MALKCEICEFPIEDTDHILDPIPVVCEECEDEFNRSQNETGWFGRMKSLFSRFQGD